MATIHKHLKSILDSGDYSDFIVTCKGKTFMLHRAVVCPQSEFFKAALTGSFKEGRTGVVDLPEDNPVIFKYLVDFLYTGNYELVETAFVDSTNTNPPAHILGKFPSGLSGIAQVQHPNWVMLTEARIYTIADKFLIPDLKSASLARFEQSVTNAEGQADWKFTDFAAIVSEVYDKTSDANSVLRKPLRRLFLAKRVTNGFWDAMQVVMGSHAEFGLEVLRDWHEQSLTVGCNHSYQRNRCVKCGVQQHLW